MCYKFERVSGICVLLKAIDKEKTYDYIICGGGASGLLLAHKLLEDPFFQEAKIALIEKDHKNQNDRTWCFWEPEEGAFDSILHHRWKKGYFGASNYSSQFPLKPFEYKMLRSQPFYESYYKRLEETPQIDLWTAEITSLDPDGDLHRVQTSAGDFYGKRIFSSLFDPKFMSKQQKYPVLHQHFLGWFVRTEKAVFDPERIHFMDFDIPQNGATRFIYVLPFSPTEALVEYTLFSPTLLTEQAYEAGIKEYLETLDCGDFEILEKEQGSIPMTCYRFDRHNTDDLLYIGTAGGWTKASTGFTFKKTTEKIDALVEFLKTNQSFKHFWKPDRFWFYDLLFLDVLSQHNARGHELFRTMFQNNSPELILKFLGEKTHFWEELKIMLAFPIPLFVKVLWKRLF